VRVGLGVVAVAALVSGCAPTSQVRRSRGEYEICASDALDRARAKLAVGDDEDALVDLRLVVEECSDFAPGHILYQDTALELGGREEELMRAHYASFPDDPSSPIPPFVHARLAPSPAEARDLYEAALAVDSSFHFAYYELGELMRRVDRTSLALENLQNAVRSRPDHPESNLALAQVLVELGRVEEARPRYATYLRARPADRSALKEYVDLLVYGVGDVRAARPHVEELVAQDPEDIEAMMDAAALAWLEGDRDAAADGYRAVLDQEPGRARAVLNLANLLYRRPDRPDAEKQRDWPRARLAYLYFLSLDEADDINDLRDLLTSVPYRLRRIDEFLGPAPADLHPRPGDF
jgi:Flp pilus assembly protein TadD